MGIVSRISPPSKSPSRKTWIWILTAIVLSAVIVVVTVPVVMLRRLGGGKVPSRPSVLVPLYIYPEVDAWNPLYDALSKYPSLTFTIVVNPNSGPGGSQPDANYTRELTKLNTFNNAKTVGYVSTDYSKRNLSLVLQDITTYTQWNASYLVGGIFFDETPSQYEPRIATYLTSINAAVRNPLQGFGPEAMIIHNPGTIPDSRYMGPTGPNITITFEATYQTFFQYGMLERVQTLRADPTKLASIVHSIPDNMTKEEVAAFVNQVKVSTSNVFVTDLASDIYSTFGYLWPDFVADMAS